MSLVCTLTLTNLFSFTISSVIGTTFFSSQVLAMCPLPNLHASVRVCACVCEKDVDVSPRGSM